MALIALHSLWTCWPVRRTLVALIALYALRTLIALIAAHGTLVALIATLALIALIALWPTEGSLSALVPLYTLRALHALWAGTTRASQHAPVRYVSRSLAWRQPGVLDAGVRRAVYRVVDNISNEVLRARRVLPTIPEAGASLIALVSLIPTLT
jgi:hypothetical protein